MKLLDFICSFDHNVIVVRDSKTSELLEELRTFDDWYYSLYLNCKVTCIGLYFETCNVYVVVSKKGGNI